VLVSAALKRAISKSAQAANSSTTAARPARKHHGLPISESADTREMVIKNSLR